MSDVCSLEQRTRSFGAYAVSIEEMNRCAEDG